MPRNGSGQYTLPSGNPVVTGTTISSSGWAIPTLSDIANAITASIAVDGQTTPTANLPMGNFRHTGVANAQNANEYATVSQIQSAGLALLGGATVGRMSLTGLTVHSVNNDQGPIIVDGTANTSYGASIALVGNGATTPNKYIRALNGSLSFVNSNYTQQIASLDDSGNFTAQGTVTGANITGSSDERLKEDWRPLARDFLERMAGVLHGTFSWKEDGSRSAGVGAASLRDVFPEVVHEDARGMLSVAYGHAALVTVLELIPYVLRLLDEHGETP